ncbi:hypothetical protein F5887DRAFT_922171 [Amanita rubescens]|nr:hypothetical protein F5887DRAFT_922171 [Amanita rubescens]
MPISEPQGQRVVSPSCGPYNIKDPPEIGSRRDPALSQYLRERNNLKNGFSVTREAHEYIQEKVRLEPNSNEWRLKLRAASKLMACHEMKLSSQKRELHARYERKYDDFRRKEFWKDRDRTRSEREKIRVEEQKKSDEKLDLWCRELLEALIRETESHAKPSTIAMSVGSAIRAASNPHSSELKGKTMPSPTHTPNCSSQPRPASHKGIRSQATPATIQEVSNPEAPNSPERAQMTRHRANPSSAKPDSPAAHQGATHEPPLAPKHMTMRPKSLMSTTEMVSAFSRPARNLSVHANPLEQYITTVLNRESPKGNSLTGVTPSSRVVSAPAPNRANVRTPEKLSARKVEVNVEKETSACRHSPLPNAALTPHNSTAILSMRPPLAKSPKDKKKPSSQVTSKPSPSIVVNAHRVVSEKARRNIETHAGVLLKTSVPRVGKPLSAGIVERLDERSKDDTGPDGQVLILSSSEVEERRPVTCTVVNRIMGKNGKTHSPLNNAVLSLRNPLPPPVSLALASCVSRSKDGSAPSSLSSLSSREVATQLASNVTRPRVPLLFSSPRFGETPLHAVSGGRKHSITGSENAARNGTHLNKEACTKVSSNTNTPRVGEPPPVDALERSKKRSNVVVGPATKRALIASSSEMEERRRVPTTIVSKRKGTNEEIHAPVDNTTFWLPSPMLVSLISTLHACPSLDEVIPLSPAAATPDTVHAVNNRRLASVNAYRKAETLVRVSLETATSTAGAHEHSYECSNLSKGLLYNEVLDKSTSDMTMEERRALEALVNTRCKNGELSSPAPKAAPTLLKSTPVASIRALPAGSSSPRRAPLDDSSKDGISPSSQAILKSSASNVVGPAVEQALASLPAEEGERRRITDAIVSIHNGEKEEEYSPNPSIAFTLQAPTPTTPFVLPMNAASPHQPSDDSIPPLEVISGRHDIDVVNKTSEVYSLHSPSLETARKRSNHSDNPFSIEGEGQLARAAVYIQERLKRRSAAFDEFRRHNLKIPPDKPSEFASIGIVSRRLEVDVVNREMKASQLLSRWPQFPQLPSRMVTKQSHDDWNKPSRLIDARMSI